MPLNNQKHPPYRFVLCWLTAFLLESPFVFTFFLNDYFLMQRDLNALIATHVMAATTMFFSRPKSKSWIHYSRHWPILFFFLVLFLPVFGILLCLALYFIRPIKNPESIFEDDDQMLLDSQECISQKLIVSHQNFESMISEGIDFIPFADILNGNDIDLKRGAVEQLTQFPTNEAIKLLQKHITDESYEVRYFITNALNKIKDKFDNNLEAIKQEYVKNPNDIEIQLKLAEIFITQAQSGIFDTFGSNEYINTALVHINNVIAKSKPNKRALELLRLVYRYNNDRSSELKIIYELKMNHWLTDKEALQHIATYMFETRDYLGLFESLEELSNEPNLDSKWQSTIGYWGIQK